MFWIYVLSFILAFGLSLYGTPMAREAAVKYGIVDRPDGNLKNQKMPVPYLGGLSIYLSFLLTLALTFKFSQEVLGLMLSGTIVLLLGLIDDFGVLSPKVKLAGQAIAVFVLVKSDIYIKLAFIPHWVQIVITVFWLLGLINGFNLIDIMDGLSAGVALIATLILFIVSIIGEREMVAVMSAALAGSLLGFLRYNFYPAKIYMGDAGSMFIGLMLAALSMNGNYTKVNNIAALAPLLILGVPIFDTLFVSYLRLLRGMSIFRGSRDHFPLRLRKWKLSIVQTVIVSYVVTFLLGGVALLIMKSSSQNAAISIVITLAFLVGVAFWLKQIDMGM
jgi:UDP-GlcNAc:undecaprenyl-phosphate GlcNAc-1-phosphate transferase